MRAAPAFAVAAAVALLLLLPVLRQVGLDLRTVLGPAAFVPSRAENMNGAYPVESPGTPGGKPGLFPKRYADWPGGVEYFDVYSPPITTLYSQVWEAPLAPVSLPADVVQRYAGKKMAIVGWEIDQVRRTPEGDVSVPITASYNHHYNAVMTGAGARFRTVVVDGPEDPDAMEVMRQHGDHGAMQYGVEQYLVEELNPGQPYTHHFVTSANGGEYRKSLHGFPPGFAAVIESPQMLQVSPMQIDTWNRAAMNISGPMPPPFVPGPEPRSSLAPSGSLHSGLLECPMSTRVTKVVDETYSASTGACSEAIITAQECFEAAPAALAGKNLSFVYELGTSSNRPEGCTVTLNAGTPTYVFFNDAAATGVACAGNTLCVCPNDPKPFGAATGSLHYHRTAQTADQGIPGGARFGGGGKTCPPFPRSVLNEQKNPTCDIRHYRGGQWACGHLWSLLDADQEIPWADQPLVFHHKWRVWAQPFDETTTQPVTVGNPTPWLLVGSPWEYDVPKCDHGIPGCALVNGTWIHTISGSQMGNGRMVSLNNHCHAPTCFSVRIYACPKGMPVEQCNDKTGELICRTDPIQGGTGHPDIAGTRFDEPGYIANPECFWGRAENGLEAPIDLTGRPVHVVKLSNATWGHLGEMSGGQPWGF